MTWHVLAGDCGDVYELLLRNWCQDNGVETDDVTLAKMLSLHLERGVGYLSGTRFIRSIDDLLVLGFKGAEG